jgi:hypothetical protein
VVSRPAFFGIKPELVIKGGFIAWGAMGDSAASLMTCEPILLRPQWGAFGRAAALSASFVHPLAIARGLGAELGLSKTLLPPAARAASPSRTCCERFIRRRAELDGRWVDYLLHDQPVGFLKGKLRLRQVTRLCDNGHQTQVITNRWDLRDIEVAYRMFERWRQENFFKYMREEFLLDALIDYQIEPEDPTRTIPNPERRGLDKQIRAARADLARLEREYGAAAADNAEQRRPTMRGFKVAHGRLGKQLRAARAHVARLFGQRRDVSKRVEIRDLNEQAMVKLARERKHLTDIIKMVAYQAESDLLALLRPHYARAEQEGGTLLHELFATAGDIRVCDSELHVTLAPLSSPHRTRAAQALCAMLDQTAMIFPGSRLRMRFAVRPPPRIGLAFPGSPLERSAATTVAPVPRPAA